MTSSRYWPLSRMSREYSLYFGRAERAEHARRHDLGKADDGVERRAQLVAHIGEEFRLGVVRLLGAPALFGVFFGEVGEFAGLALQRLLRMAQIVDGGDAALFALDQFLFVLLELGDVGADRDVAAVLGAAFADVHPAAVVELGFEGARAGRLGVVIGDGGAQDRLAAGRQHRVVRRARFDRRVGQVMQLLEIRIAQHQAVVGVPQYERFRYGLDGVAQPQIGGVGALD